MFMAPAPRTNQKPWIRWVAMVAVASLLLLTFVGLIAGATDATAAVEMASAG
jgi:hypothetical protein